MRGLFWAIYFADSSIFFNQVNGVFLLYSRNHAVRRKAFSSMPKNRVWYFPYKNLKPILFIFMFHKRIIERYYALVAQCISFYSQAGASIIIQRIVHNINQYLTQLIPRILLKAIKIPHLSTENEKFASFSSFSLVLKITFFADFCQNSIYSTL